MLVLPTLQPIPTLIILTQGLWTITTITRPFFLRFFFQFVFLLVVICGVQWNFFPYFHGYYASYAFN